MSLLPGGDRDDASRLKQLAWAVVVVWLGYQAWMNLHRYNAIEGNLYSLSQELNLGGEAEYRRQLLWILDSNSVPITPGQIDVALDPAKNLYEVTVRTAWTLDLFWWRVTLPRIHHARFERRSWDPS